MPKRLTTLFFNKGKNDLLKLCEEKELNEYETEVIIRIYFKRQNLNYIADTMDFSQYGKKDYYTTRTINKLHKEAILKMIDSFNLKLLFW